MTLTDAGPLIALLDRDDDDHRRCRDALDSLAAPLLTTWPAFTEAIYLLDAAGSWPAESRLWQLALRGDLEVVVPERLSRVYALMQKYADTPMDLADATLVCLAEERGIRRIFTLDSDFAVYRLHDRDAFEVVP